MNKLYFPFYSALFLLLLVSPARANQPTTLQSPQPGVLCDHYFCANDQGISRKLTEMHLGNPAASKLFAQGDFDLSNFTFSNGIFCDVKERLCRENRYYDADGKRSGQVSEKYTEILFGPSHSQSPQNRQP